MSGLLPGLLGAMLAFVASNIWFFYFGPHVIPDMPPRTLLPDFFSFLHIDADVGAGCGYAGALTGPNLASLLGPSHVLGRFIPALYSAVLGTTIALIVNALLLLMSSL